MKINNDILSAKESRLLSCIETLISEKKARNKSESSPDIVRRPELEGHLESVCKDLAIPFQKKSTPTHSRYSFTIDGKQIEFEILYRYAAYYARHTVRKQD